jgi:hypothetical protein
MSIRIYNLQVLIFIITIVNLSYSIQVVITIRKGATATIIPVLGIP